MRLGLSLRLATALSWAAAMAVASAPSAAPPAAPATSGPPGPIAAGPATGKGATPSVGSFSNTLASRHWAFQPVQRPEPPSVHGAGWTEHPVDRFLLARMKAEGLRPARAAPREALLRRVTLDLTGLPPTPEETAAFVADRRPDAWERVIDRLLASPRHGERWARHWLDVVRYAESDGFEHDALRPNAWRYRDYVVNAFNTDKPYDRFVQEQVAGDELWPEDPAAVTATAFHLLGPDMVDSSDPVQRRLLTLSDMTDTTALAFLGLTLGCARCHDHKLEPFSQADYYGLQAHFAGAQFERDWPVPTPAERQAHEEAVAAHRRRAGDLERQLAALEGPARTNLLEQKLAELPEEVRTAHHTPREQRTVEQQASVLETAARLQITDAELAKALTGPERQRRNELTAALKRSPKPSPLPTTLALQTTNGPLPPTHLLRRGDYNSPAGEIPPALPVVLRSTALLPASASAAAAAAATGGPIKGPAHARRRAALAQWLTAPDHPLTARVMMNRLWQHHFGRGLVATPNDFGTQGARPTHPELLDWLASEFIARGWSLKAMHRLLLTSSAYQQSSDAPDAAVRLDPENRWFARHARTRLDAEVLRDSLLAISGRLDERAGGPSVLPPIPADLARTVRGWNAAPEDDRPQRRSLYIQVRRNFRFPFLETFDLPDSNLSCAARGQSTTAPQALTLLNSSEVQYASIATARRLLAASAPTPAAPPASTLTSTAADPTRVALAFQWILNRPPTRAERRAALAFVQTTRQRTTVSSEPHGDVPPQPAISATGPQPGPRPPTEWIELCRALFNLNEFVHAE